jgi:hypothetical protein
MESSLGIMTFKKMPRSGDWLEIESEDALYMFAVIRVVHKLVPDETGYVEEDVLYIAEPRESTRAQLELYDTFRTPD